MPAANDRPFNWSTAVSITLRATYAASKACVSGVINQVAMLASRSTPKWLLRRVGGMMAREAA